MEGISKDRLLKLREHFNKDYSIVEAKVIQDLLNECRELQEPWIPLDEFLKSGFEGMCWVYSVYKDIFVVQFIDDNFISINTGAKAQLKYIERVMPIHKPEPPKCP